jgi:hypothetical protein
MLSRATPQLAHSVSADQLARMFGWVGQLGTLQWQPICTGTSNVFAGASGTRTTGRYTCQAQYQAGPAMLELSLVKAGGAWSINGFRVNSPLLVPPKASQKV